MQIVQHSPFDLLNVVYIADPIGIEQVGEYFFVSSIVAKIASEILGKQPILSLLSSSFTRSSSLLSFLSFGQVLVGGEYGVGSILKITFHGITIFDLLVEMSEQSRKEFMLDRLSVLKSLILIAGMFQGMAQLVVSLDEVSAQIKEAEIDEEKQLFYLKKMEHCYVALLQKGFILSSSVLTIMAYAGLFSVAPWMNAALGVSYVVLTLASVVTRRLEEAAEKRLNEKNLSVLI